MLTRRKFLQMLGLAATVPAMAAMPAKEPTFEDAIVEAGVRQAEYDRQLTEELAASIEYYSNARAKLLTDARVALVERGWKLVPGLNNDEMVVASHKGYQFIFEPLLTGEPEPGQLLFPNINYYRSVYDVLEVVREAENA